MRESVELLIAWLEEHSEHFCPGTYPSWAACEEAKRAAELATVLLGVSRSPRARPSGDVYSRWARGYGRRLLRRLPAEEAPGCTENPARAFDSLPARARLLTWAALRLTTEQTTGRDARDSPPVRPSGPASPDPETAFVRDVLGTADCRPVIRARLVSSLSGPFDAGSVQEAYDLTHLVFYATRMGRRDAGWSAREAGRARARLAQAGAAALDRRDLDLLAESVLSLLYLPGRPASPFTDAAARLLADAGKAHGHLPPHPRHADEGGDAFADRYHPTLVGLAALIETARSRPSPPH